MFRLSDDNEVLALLSPQCRLLIAMVIHAGGTTGRAGVSIGWLVTRAGWGQVSAWRSRSTRSLRNGASFMNTAGTAEMHLHG